MTTLHSRHVFFTTHHIELLLKLLVGIVDAELLKCVHLKHLKPIDIQYSDEGTVTGRLRGRSESRVNDIHDPVEQGAVQVLG